MCGMGIRMHILWALKAGFDSLCAAVHVKDFFSRLVGVLIASFVSSSGQDGTQGNSNGEQAGRK